MFIISYNSRNKQVSDKGTKWSWDKGTIVVETPERPVGQTSVIGMTAPKIEAVRVGYSEQRFNEINAQIAELTKELSLSDVVVIPVSATEGDNVTTKSENIPWYKGQALLPYLEQVDVDDTEEEKGFYMPVR